MTHAARQLELFQAQGMDRSDLVSFLNEETLRPVTLRLTRNRVSMAWVDFAGEGPVRVAVDEQFLTAPPRILTALRAYVRHGRPRDWRAVAEYARGLPTHGRAHVRRTRLQRRGDVHDLGAIAGEVNRTFFSGQIQYAIGWGRDGASRKRRRRSIRFGTWTPGTKTIRIHPRLDDARVPQEFVRYIVFHEMLHAAVPAELQNGRRRHHGEQYQAMEKTFPDLPRMKSLCRELLHTLT
ncbi:MAG: SprT-like domain-containing protein [Lentisphaerae bacterium]|nr:SprT-like domain-containing protein [Lentisphaerota bacterium]